MASRKSKDAVELTREQSKAAYLAKRKKRVREIFEKEGLQPRDIAARLVNEGVIETLDESLESATRLVRADLAEIRSQIDTGRAADASPAVAINEVDALERELFDLREEHARQKMIAEGEPMEMCSRSKVAPAVCGNEICERKGRHLVFIGPAIGVKEMYTPQGPMTIYGALWPPGVRQKASKDCSILAERIRKAEVTLTEKRRALGEVKPTGEASGTSDLFALVTSGKEMSDLITSNAEERQPN